MSKRKQRTAVESGVLAATCGSLPPTFGRQRPFRRVLKSTVAIAALTLALVGSASGGIAQAGTNGQELALEPNCDANYAYIQGHNQYGQWKTQWVRVPAAFPGECYGVDTYDPGWWWKGSVRIDGYWNYKSGYNSTVWVNVPVNQGWSNNWYYTQLP
jgi:hypothetical protein